ncbi:MAG: deoxyribodipyrimidine photo-lyase [Candidatus Pelagadaptatus aseana]|uniref:cryptochrome/photolyase family protein n=1 Tax=Candidatus Pelagadaptatus aseana TaxID=3120508 RepID=UPI0039B17D25
MSQEIAICWFRQDLRISDNPALLAAAEHDQLLPIYVLDDDSADEVAMGGASRWWLHHSLQSLNSDLIGTLQFFRGDASVILRELCQRHNVTHVYWNRCYEPWRIDRDREIKTELLEQGIHAESFNASLLQEPWAITKTDGSPYKVFTPYYRRFMVQSHAAPKATPRFMPSLLEDSHSCSLSDLELLPSINWAEGFKPHWQPGEKWAHKRWRSFLDERLNNYQQGRDFPAKQSVSGLSPHLHFGEISPRQLLQDLQYVGGSDTDNDNREHFIRELAWREFSYYLLYHWPDLPGKNLRPEFDYFPWQHDETLLRQWQRGMTGYPLVDAGMRELWQTGFMHNRVRMITASFLVKNLRQDWRSGAAWFWDCLLDADLASNSASWQWVAGCGTDAAPYFRIFNPVTQSEKFDPGGDYIRQYVPELAALPNRYLHRPWEAPDDLLAQAGITLGKDYPHPMIDLAESRAAALDAFAAIKTVEPTVAVNQAAQKVSAL